MIHEQDRKVAVLVAPGTVATSATASAKIDTATFDYAAIDAIFPVATATNSSAKWGVLQLSESDDTSFTNATSIAAFSGTTNTSATTGFVIPAQNDTTNPQVTRLMVDCRARKRYLYLTYQSGASHSTCAVVGALSRAEQPPVTDAARGANVVTVIG